MWKKNSWNKKYEMREREYKVRDKTGKILKDEKGKPILDTKKEKVLAAGGLKASPKELAFKKMIEKAKTKKPNKVYGDWAWD